MLGCLGDHLPAVLVEETHILVVAVSHIDLIAAALYRVEVSLAAIAHLVQHVEDAQHLALVSLYVLLRDGPQHAQAAACGALAALHGCLVGIYPCVHQLLKIFQVALVLVIDEMGAVLTNHVRSMDSAQPVVEPVGLGFLPLDGVPVGRKAAVGIEGVREFQEVLGGAVHHGHGQLPVIAHRIGGISEEGREAVEHLQALAAARSQDEISVVHTVAVGIVISTGMGIGQQLFLGGRDAHPELVQPVLAEGNVPAVGILDGILGHRGNLAIVHSGGLYHGLGDELAGLGHVGVHLPGIYQQPLSADDERRVGLGEHHQVGGVPSGEHGGHGGLVILLGAGDQRQGHIEPLLQPFLDRVVLRHHFAVGIGLEHQVVMDAHVVIVIVDIVRHGRIHRQRVRKLDILESGDICRRGTSRLTASVLGAGILGACLLGAALLFLAGFLRGRLLLLVSGRLFAVTAAAATGCHRHCHSHEHSHKLYCFVLHFHNSPFLKMELNL